MKRNEIPDICRKCTNMRAWSLDMGGNHDYDCRVKPTSMVGKEDCDKFEMSNKEINKWE